MPPTLGAKPIVRIGCVQRPSKSSQFTQIRCESSYRRHVQRLSLPPAPSFAPKPTNPSNSHIIFNPPAASPNLYHTPLKFLPENDRRRQLYASAAPSLYNVARGSRQTPTYSPIAKPGTALHESSRTIPAALLPQLPPGSRIPTPLKAPYEKKYHLTEVEIAEIQRLRAMDPKTWTRARLAAKFECSNFFIGIAAKNEKAGKEHEARIEMAKKRWGPGRRLARYERGRRKELWGKDL